ncbi:hypothetical protein GBAR_LOCUS23179 [Geodia barretti]|uniref:Uncharacterized protein n=2 Tax=Geodia barretti TaxID=519541 RepID=A0AA35T6B5_GEOBA|nr:hypothetical protein GBAR_LOCUS23179 [Geodia barretti]
MTEALDKTLTEADTEEIVENLASAHTQSFVLGIRFNLPLHEVEAIHSEYLDIHGRFLQIILAFLKQQNPKPTWRVIIEALRSPIVNLPGLADELEAQEVVHVTPSTDSEMSAGPTVLSVSG